MGPSTCARQKGMAHRSLRKEGLPAFAHAAEAGNHFSPAWGWSKFAADARLVHEPLLPLCGRKIG